MAFLFFIFRFFCSLKLAIGTISALILLFAIGTFYESIKGRDSAQELIYDSIYMNVLLSLLALNIIAVMLDRIPWKKRHAGFLLAHFGILFVIAGAFITRFHGVDGYIRLNLGQQAQHIREGDTFLNVYASFDGAHLNRLYKERVFFFRQPPSHKKPYVIRLGGDLLKVKGFYPVATVRESYKPAEKGGTALRFLIEGNQAQEVRWLFRPPYQEKVELSLGPAKVFLMKSLPSLKTGTYKIHTPALLLAPHKKSLQYQFIKSGKITTKGILKKGDKIKTGWADPASMMNGHFHLLEYWPQALPHRVFTPVEKATNQSQPAIQVFFKGDKRWMGLNSQLFFFDEDKVYIVAYGHEQKKLDFSLKLKKFKVQHYPFSRKARSYESEVEISPLLFNPHSLKTPLKKNHSHKNPRPSPAQQENKETKALISMNKPLKWGSWTIYQSGFEENKRGEPIASVFSVNKDPGRFIKYLGSLLIVLGVLVLFIKRNLSTSKRVHIPS